jgi:hypothetical protein
MRHSFLSITNGDQSTMLPKTLAAFATKVRSTCGTYGVSYCWWLKRYSRSFSSIVARSWSRLKVQIYVSGRSCGGVPFL